LIWDGLRGPAKEGIYFGTVQLSFRFSRQIVTVLLIRIAPFCTVWPERTNYHVVNQWQTFCRNECNRS